MIYTRKDYMGHKCTHADYYRSIAFELGIDYTSHHELDTIKACLETGDENLKRIPLRTWDSWGVWMLGNRAAHEAFKRRGDSLSLAGVVCVLKQAAKDAAAPCVS